MDLFSKLLPNLRKLFFTIVLLAFLSVIVSSPTIIAQDIESYNEDHPGYELTFSATILPLSGSSDLAGWTGLNGKSDQGFGFSLEGIFYQRLKQENNRFYDFGIAFGYTKMGEIDPAEDDENEFYGLGAFEIGVALRNPLWGFNNPAIVQSITLMAISPTFAQFQDTDVSTSIGAGMGVRARIGYQKPASLEQAFTFFVEGQYSRDISRTGTDFYTLGVGVQLNFLFQN